MGEEGRRQGDPDACCFGAGGQGREEGSHAEAPGEDESLPWACEDRHHGEASDGKRAAAMADAPEKPLHRVGFRQGP